MPVSKNHSPGIGLLPIEAESLGQCLSKQAQSLKRPLPGAVARNLKLLCAGHDIDVDCLAAIVVGN